MHDLGNGQKRVANIHYTALVGGAYVVYTWHIQPYSIHSSPEAYETGICILTWLQCYCDNEKTNDTLSHNDKRKGPRKIYHYRKSGFQRGEKPDSLGLSAATHL